MSLLPYDILFFILIGLPAKSLLRFQSVSKLWDSAISDKKFKKAHCDQSKALGRLKFLLRKRVSTYTPSSAGNTSLWIRPILRKNTTFKESNTHRLPFFQCSNNISYVKVYEEIEFVELKNPQVVTEKQQFPLTGSQISVLCSHDGLLLLCTYKACDEFVLWNPSTRQDKKFVCPYVITPTCIVPNACGLCYDSITGDYKFILIFRSFYVVCSANNNLWMMRNTLPVLEENLAETINSSWSNLSYYGITEGISTSEGCVYWSLDCPLYTSRRKLLVQQVSKNSRIIRFDAKSYKLKELPAPDFVGEGELFCLSTLKGCLILNGGKVKDQESNIWIKEEDGWKWLLKVRRLPAYIEQTKLLYCTEDGEYIFLGPMKDHVSISDPKRDTYDVQSYKPDQSEYVNALADPSYLKLELRPRMGIGPKLFRIFFLHALFRGIRVHPVPSILTVPLSKSTATGCTSHASREAPVNVGPEIYQPLLQDPLRLHELGQRLATHLIGVDFSLGKIDSIIDKQLVIVNASKDQNDDE